MSSPQKLAASSLPLWLALIFVAILFAPATAAPGDRPAAIPLNILDHPVNIDGDLAKWGDLLVGGCVIDEHLQHVSGYLNPTRSNATVFKILHDDQALYLVAHVLDSSVNVSPNALWNGDCLELFIDVRPVGDSGSNLGDPFYSPGAFQIRFAPPSDKIACRWGLGSSGGPIGDIQYASRLLPDGYSIEARIPFASIDTTRQRMDQPIGIDVAVDNVDVIDDRTRSDQYIFGSVGSGALSLGDIPRAEHGLPGLREKAGPIYVRPAAYHFTGRDRFITGGFLAWAKPATGNSGNLESPGMRVSLHYLGNPYAHISADSAAVTAQLKITRFAYPAFGLVTTEAQVVVDEVKTGRYELVTTVGSSPPRTTHFEGVGWTRTPAPVLAERPGVDTPNTTTAGQYLLFNGWMISPVGLATPLMGDMPVKMLWSPDHTRLLVQTSGYHDQGVYVFNPATSKVEQHVVIRATWAGMAWSADGKCLLVSGAGVHNTGNAQLYSIPWDGSKLGMPRQMRMAVAARPVKPGAKRVKPFIAGIAANASGIYVLNMSGSALWVSKADQSPVIALPVKVGRSPYALALSPSGVPGSWAAISNWGGLSVSLVELDHLDHPVKTIAVGSHPNELLWAPDGRIFVACSGSNSVAVIRNGAVVETIKTCLDPNAPVGSTPIALALAPDQQRLYVANADNNDVAVIDISNPGESRIIGLIPTGWYPSSLAISADNSKLYVGIGKGMTFLPNPKVYIGEQLNGAVEAIDVPTLARLGQYTRQVIANTPAPQRLEGLTQAQQGILAHAFPRIKHVLWIIRENRTYDQVLGDLPKGNGDPNLVMYGKDVTPNAHALAQEFTLFDNLYCSGEVSEDGHQWCNAAYATDFTEKAWINSYSHRDEPPDTDESLRASPAGYLWDNCAAHHVSYRSYGEFGSVTADRDHPPVFHGSKGLKGHVSLTWDQQRGLRDYQRVKAFISELHEGEDKNDWPAYMVMSLGEDHTRGASPGEFTPNASVASNDLALGKIVDAVTHSRFWPETAIFVMEDDAQDGPDHVDAHRTVGLVISPYVRRHTLDPTLYTTVSFLHSMELILGLPPMTQYDSSATPIYNAMTESPDVTPFTCLDARINMAQRNGDTGPDAEASAKMDFSEYDRCDPQALNAILWHLARPGEPVPAPVRAVHWLSGGE